MELEGCRDLLLISASLPFINGISQNLLSFCKHGYSFFTSWRIVWIGYSNKQPSQGTRKVTLRRDEWLQSGNRLVAILSWATLEAGIYAFPAPSPG